MLFSLCVHDPVCAGAPVIARSMSVCITVSKESMPYSAYGCTTKFQPVGNAKNTTRTVVDVWCLVEMDKELLGNK